MKVLLVFGGKSSEFEVSCASAASVIRNIMATFDQLVHGIATGINDILAPNKTIQIVNDEGEVEEIKVLDEENAPIGMDANATMGEALFNRKSTPRYTTTTLNVGQTDEYGNPILDGAGNPVTQTQTIRVYNEENPEDNYSLYTITEIEVNPEIIENYSMLPLSTIGNGGDFGYTGVNKMLLKLFHLFVFTVFKLATRKF